MRRGWSGGVVATRAAGTAAEDAFERAPRAAPGAVFLDRVERVLAAGGVEAAVAAHESAEGGAVEEDEEGKEARHCS